MVSLITVNYNNTAVTLSLLDSVRRSNLQDFEMIVVDNGSTDDPSTLLKAAHPWSTIIRSDVNLGFAGGNNLGAKLAKGDFLFFINNDTEFTKNILTRLTNILKQHPRIGVVCPVLCYFDLPGKIQFAGFTKMNPLTGRNSCLTSIPLAANGVAHTAYAHGAAMMMSRDVFKKIGPMAENYFLYYEELDWSEQVKRKGYSIAVDTWSMLYHKESSTVGPVSELKSYFTTRNRILFMRRNVRLYQLAAFWIYFVCVATPVQIFRYARRQQWKNVRAHVAGICWNVRSHIHSATLGYKFNHLRNMKPQSTTT